MKEKRTKKESNKEEAKKEAHPGMADVRFSGEAKPREDLKIDWPSFISFYNAILRLHGREGIRIHAGNTVKDTSGCILVGKATQRGVITDSRRTLAILKRRLGQRPLGDPVRLTIEPGEPIEDGLFLHSTSD